MSDHALPLFAVRLDELHVRAAKRRLAAVLPGVGSVHLTEALAAGLGFPSHRVLLDQARRAAADPAAPQAAPFDNARFLGRLAGLGHLMAPTDFTVVATGLATLAPDWPVRMPFGLHVIASGLCATPVPAVEAAIGAMARVWSAGGLERCGLLRCGRAETSLIAFDPAADGRPRARVEWSYPTGGPAARFGRVNTLRTWPWARAEEVVVYDDVATADEALHAFETAMCGFYVILGIRAASARDALGRLAALGVQGYKLRDETLVRRVDVAAQAAPPRLLESHRTPERLRALLAPPPGASDHDTQHEGGSGD